MHSGAARLLFQVGHNSPYFSFSPLSSLQIPFPFFLYLHITNLQVSYPVKSSYIAGHCKSVSFPRGAGWSLVAKQFLVHFEAKLARCTVAPLLTVALKCIRLERGYITDRRVIVVRLLWAVLCAETGNKCTSMALGNIMGQFSMTFLGARPPIGLATADALLSVTGSKRKVHLR